MQPVRPREPDLAERLDSANDYYEFAKSVHATSRSGDPQSQFYLSEAISYCESGYRMYFERGTKVRTLDEALQWASTRPATSPEEARLIYERCHRLKEQDRIREFGHSRDWLARSAAGGHPLAQVELATQLLNEAEQASFAGKREDFANDLRTSAHQMIARAIKSREPAAIWKIGDMQRALSGSERDAESEQWVWRLAACKRGYECGPTAPWVKFACRFDVNCQPYESGIDLIRRFTSQDFYAVQERAEALDKRLDEGAWAELGLDFLQEPADRT